jgi:hypothetical protein
MVVVLRTAATVVLIALCGLAHGADWRPIGQPTSSHHAILDHDSVHIIPLSSGDLYLFNWARIFAPPIIIWNDKPLVAHHIIGISMLCDDSVKAVMVTSEEFLSENFAVIKQVTSDKAPAFSDDMRQVSDIAGMSQVRSYICENKSRWQIAQKRKP